jgi:bis(5'-nucleosyl)-tetraphosphatase (symmetrical)
MATWAIGDVHGCYRSLRALLARPALASAEAYWFVGDLVNRGPRSLETLRFVADLGERATVVLGNHDLHFLARAAGVTPARRHDSLEALLAAPDLDELAEWMRQRQLLFMEGERLLVHAGLLASWSLAESIHRARRAESALRSAEAPFYLKAFRPGGELGGSLDPEILADLRVFALMRTVDAEGRPTYDYTGTIAGMPAGRFPWFEAPNRRSAGTRIVCGHWAALGLVVRDELWAIDTGCAWGESLTAIRIEDGRIERTDNVEWPRR